MACAAQVQHAMRFSGAACHAVVLQEAEEHVTPAAFVTGNELCEPS